MNYQRIYDELIAAAKNRLLQDVYTEKHHIVPRSMGGSNKKANLVSLTAREHFVAHLLLWKIHKNQQMAWALMMMSGKLNAKINSRMFCNLRQRCARDAQFREYMSKIHKGKTVSQATRDKLSKLHKGRKCSEQTKIIYRQAQQLRRQKEKENNPAAVNERALKMRQAKAQKRLQFELAKLVATNSP